jgi:hypothetical protein
MDMLKEDDFAEKILEMAITAHPFMQFFRSNTKPDDATYGIERTILLTALIVMKAGGKNPETQVALRKLLECKDAALRAMAIKTQAAEKPKLSTDAMKKLLTALRTDETGSAA